MGNAVIPAYTKHALSAFTKKFFSIHGQKWIRKALYFL